MLSSSFSLIDANTQMKYYLSFIVLLFAVMIAYLSLSTDSLAQVNANAIDDVNYTPPFAVTTWTERNDKTYTIITRSCLSLATKTKNAVWSEPLTVHESEHPIISSNLVTLSNGSQILIWSQHEKSKSTIRFKTKDPLRDNWSEPDFLFKQGTENIGLSTLRINQTVWAFWASTQHSLPDINYAIYANGRWGTASTLHPENNVPDLLPIASINEDNDIEVNWLSYSFLHSDYQQAKKTISNSLVKPSQVDIINPEEFETPFFLPQNQSVTIRFPRNHYQQSSLISSNNLYQVK